MDVSRTTYRIRVRIADKELEVEGDRDFVLETCLNLHTRLLGANNLSIIEPGLIIFNDQNEATITAEGNGNVLISETANGLSSKRPMPLASFLREAGAATSADKVLVVAAYLYKHRDYGEFNRADIEQCYREALLKKSTNFSRDINSNRQKGFFDLAGEKDGLKAFYITRAGLDAVESMMAQRE